MAKAKKRVATRKKSSKRGKASAMRARRKAAKRTMPKQAKSKVRGAAKPMSNKQRQSKIVGQGVGRAHGNDAQGDVAANHALQNVMDGSVPPAGKDRVATCGDRLMRLFRCIRLGARRLNDCLNSSLAQNRQRRLHLCQSSRPSPARQRVVKENGLAHGK